MLHSLHNKYKNIFTITLICQDLRHELLHEALPKK